MSVKRKKSPRIKQDLECVSIHHDELEKELKELGYTPLLGILAEKEYMKAINPMGQTVYILIENGQGIVDLKCTETEPIMTYGAKVSALQASDLDVVFECEGLCFLERHVDNKHVTIKECHFSLPQKLDCCISYPIIKLSDIKNNPSMVDYVDKTIRCLKNKEFNTQLSHQVNIQETLKSNQENHLYLMQLWDKKAKKLNKAIDEFHSYYQYYIKNPDEVKLNKIKMELHALNESVNQLISSQRKIAHFQLQLNEFSAAIMDLIND